MSGEATRRKTLGAARLESGPWARGLEGRRTDGQSLRVFAAVRWLRRDGSGDFARVYCVVRRRGDAGDRIAFALDAFEDFLAVDGDRLGCSNAEADLAAVQAQHRQGDLVTDHDSFADAPCDDQHGGRPVVRVILTIGRCRR
jgi:hypothetical protein